MTTQPENLPTEGVENLVEYTSSFSEKIATLDGSLQVVSNSPQYVVAGVDPLVFAISVFVLSCFVGYYVVWRVTPALHTPLMSVTNAISSIIVIGAIIAAGVTHIQITNTLGLVAVTIASINIFGGFVVTQRMLHMFRKKGTQKS